MNKKQTVQVLGRRFAAAREAVERYRNIDPRDYDPIRYHALLVEERRAERELERAMEERDE